MNVYFSPQEYAEAESYNDVRENLGLVLYSKEVASEKEKAADAVFVKEELPGGIVAFLEVLMQDEDGSFYHVPLDTEQVVDEVLDIQEMIADGIACMSEKLPAIFAREDPRFYVLHTDSPFGAASIMYPDLMERIGDEVGSSYFILPANRDMMIITPDDGTKGLDALEAALIEQNKKADPELILSNTVLYYDGHELKTAREVKSDGLMYLNRTMNDYMN